MKHYIMEKIFILMAIAAMFTACSQNRTADTVIYGSIYTSSKDTPLVEAAAIKDGKWIYTGDKAGVRAFIKEGVTEVIDHEGKGMVMAGCTEGHAHHMMAAALIGTGGTVIGANDNAEVFLQKVKEAYTDAKSKGMQNLFGFGWNYFEFNREGFPTLEQLDEACPDIALYMNDNEGHKGLVNTLTLKKAGIIDENGNVIKDKIRGGEICLDKNGKPTGLVKEQAGTYIRAHGFDFTEMLPDEVAESILETTQQMLLCNGYTAFMDGWSNYFGIPAFYEAAQRLDGEGKLGMNLCFSYEVESWCEDLDAAISTAADWKKYASAHFHPDYLKIFMDGTVETGTGFTFDEYVTGGHGTQNWTQEEMDHITETANGNGLTMHVHTMGDAAVNTAINAFESHGQKDMRNCLVHIRNVKPEDFQRIADNGIIGTVGMLWHALSEKQVSNLSKTIPASCLNTSYPIGSHVNCGSIISSSSDFPATSGMPHDPFGIMEIAVTASWTDAETGEYMTPWDTKEIITRDQALEILTLNGAKQLGLDSERGSIEEGKFADFLLVDKNVMECPEREMHTAKVLATYFEGRKVYSAE